MCRDRKYSEAWESLIPGNLSERSDRNEHTEINLTPVAEQEHLLSEVECLRVLQGLPLRVKHVIGPFGERMQMQGKLLVHTRGLPEELDVQQDKKVNSRSCHDL